MFLPLGMGASLVAALLLDYRDMTILAAGLMLIVFGVMELAGRGFSFVPARMGQRFQTGQSAAAIFGTGLVYGITGFCSGPLLGAVLTIAASTANPLLGAALLFTYSLGTAAPLFAVAWFWDRYQLGRRAWLRGRPVKIGPVVVFSTNLVAGVLFIVLGVSFIAFQGASVLSTSYDDLGLTYLGFRAQLWVADNLVKVPDFAWVVAIAVMLSIVWVRRCTGRSALSVADHRTNSPGAVATASRLGSDSVKNTESS